MNLTLARTEAKLLAREPLAVFWGIVFPLVLLVVIGIASGDHHDKELHGMRTIDVYVPTMMVFVMAILSLQGLPQVLTGYRERGYLRRLSTTPVGARRVLGIQLGLNLGVTILAMLVIAVVGRVAFSVSLPKEVGGFLLTIALTGAAMLAIGMLLASVAGNTRIAGVLGSLAFFPMMFFAGLWVPEAEMGRTLRDIGHLTPLGSASAAVQQTMAGNFPSLAHLAVLAGYAVILFPLALRFFRWEQ